MALCFYAGFSFVKHSCDMWGKLAFGLIKCERLNLASISLEYKANF
ncbi:hypothetical protein [Helicobacter cinaedi]|nr:hypothetical protein [Helicobacter cinaedi]